MKNKLNPKIKEIVSVLYRYEGGMSANEISSKTGVSYLTTQKYLKILEEKGIVNVWKESYSKKKYAGRGQTIRYTLNYELIKDLK